MTKEVDLYDGHYGQRATNPQVEVRAEREGVSSLVSFHVVDAGQLLPFADVSFDAVFCNDSINHLPGRSAVLQDCYRILRPQAAVCCSPMRLS
jgi:ubiquinone/menaquinone biosynthesis C-methylase UbiE